MDWDDKYNDGLVHMGFAPQREESIPDKSTEAQPDPMDMANPVSVYLFLSDDAQDEVEMAYLDSTTKNSCHQNLGISFTQITVKSLKSQQKFLRPQHIGVGQFLAHPVAGRGFFLHYGSVSNGSIFTKFQQGCQTNT